MRTTKRLTVSALTVALGVVFMSLGAVLEVFDLSAVALASLLMVFIYLELGSPYTWLVWLATSLATALIFPASALWLEYLLIFGIYPVIKGYIERLPSTLWILIKSIYALVTLALAFLGAELILGIPFIEGELFGLPTYAIYLIFAAVGVLAFLLYDLFINIMVRFYFDRLRPRIKNLLK
jgi:hypothetical protein